MNPEMRRAKLRTLCEIEGYEDQAELFAAAMTDTVCPALFELKEDARPPSERTAAGRYMEATLFDRNPR